MYPNNILSYLTMAPVVCSFAMLSVLYDNKERKKKI